MIPSGMSKQVPGEGTTISYAGPPELRRDLPARDPESARAEAREILSRTASMVADAEGVVASMPSRPGSFDRTLLFLRSQNLAALAAAQGSDPFRALAEVRRISQDVAEAAEALTLAARDRAINGGGR